MIYDYPITNGKGESGDPLAITAQQAAVLMPVVHAIVDDLAERLKIQAETVDEQVKKIQAYIKYRLTLQRKPLVAVTDLLEASLQDRLSEQQVLINSVAPGIFDVADQLGGIGKTPSGPSSPGTFPLADDVVVPVPAVQSGTGGDVKPITEPAPDYPPAPIPPIPPVDIGSFSPVAYPGCPPCDKVTPVCPPPVTVFHDNLVTLNFPSGIQITSNVNVVDGELQIYPPGSSSPIVVPIIIAKDYLTTLIGGGDIAVIVKGNQPQTIVCGSTQTGVTQNVPIAPGIGGSILAGASGGGNVQGSIGQSQLQDGGGMAGIGIASQGGTAQVWTGPAKTPADQTPLFLPWYVGSSDGTGGGGTGGGGTGGGGGSGGGQPAPLPAQTPLPIGPAYQPLGNGTSQVTNGPVCVMVQGYMCGPDTLHASTDGPFRTQPLPEIQPEGMLLADDDYEWDDEDEV